MILSTPILLVLSAHTIIGAPVLEPAPAGYIRDDMRIFNLLAKRQDDKVQPIPFLITTKGSNDPDATLKPIGPIFTPFVPLKPTEPLIIDSKPPIGPTPSIALSVAETPTETPSSASSPDPSAPSPTDSGILPDGDLLPASDDIPDDSTAPTDIGDAPEDSNGISADDEEDSDTSFDNDIQVSTDTDDDANFVSPEDEGQE